jgi:hypothetical protein
VWLGRRTPTNFVFTLQTTLRGYKPAESGWHRRLRKQRRSARKLLKDVKTGAAATTGRVQAARKKLLGHHGSTPPTMPNQEWVCRHAKCGTHNYIHKEQCRTCGQTWDGSEDVVTKQRSSSAKRRAAKDKGGAEVNDLAKKVAALLGRPAPPAAPQPPAAPRPPTAASTDVDDVAKRVAALLATTAKKPLPPPPPPPPPANAGQSLSSEDKTADEKIAALIEGKSKMLAMLKEMGDETSPSAQALQVEIEQAQARRLQLKPLQTRMEEASETLVELRKQQSVIEETIAELYLRKGEVDAAVAEAKVRYDEIQILHHNENKPPPQPETRTGPDPQAAYAQAELMKYAIENKDGRLYLLVTGENMPVLPVAAQHPPAEGGGWQPPASYAASSSPSASATALRKDPLVVQNPKSKRRTIEERRKAAPAPAAGEPIEPIKIDEDTAVETAASEISDEDEMIDDALFRGAAKEKPPE